MFPSPRPFAWPPALALAPNLYLPSPAPNLYLLALAPNLYLLALAPNLYLSRATWNVSVVDTNSEVSEVSPNRYAWPQRKNRKNFSLNNARFK